MPRAGLTPRIVVETGAAIADEDGLERLTLAEVAKRLGVALPSLYKHIAGLDALRQGIAALATDELAAALSTAAAGRAGSDALRAVAVAYRAYAHAHPGRYPATQRAPDPGDATHVAAAERAVATVFATLRAYDLEGDDAVDATRILRSALHGFVLLEQGGGFGLPRDLDRTFDALVTAVDHALRDWPRGAAR